MQLYGISSCRTKPFPDGKTVIITTANGISIV